jgi:hypothetical protein
MCENAPIDELQASEMIGVSPATLRKWRSIGRGPSYIKYGETRAAMVRYLPSEVLKWRAAQVRKTSVE